MNEFSMKNVLKKNVMALALLGIYILFIILGFAIKGQNILEPSIVTSLIERYAYVFILGAGMLMCMLTGGNIDLSVGSFVCFAGAIVGLFSVENRIFQTPLSTPLVILIAFGVGIAYGALLGFLIAYVRIPPWIATLAGYLAFRGLGTQYLTKASADAALTNFPDSLTKIFGGRLFESDWGEMNIPCVVIGVVVAAAVVLTLIISRNRKVAEKTTIGRHFMTVGGNAESARLSGINNKLVMFCAYLNMAVLTVIAAMIVTVRASAANSTAGEEYELDAIAACIVGGVSAYGGSGTIVGMVVGATLIGVINQGMQLIGVDQNWIKIVKGLVLLAAVVFEIKSKNSKAKASKKKTKQEKTLEEVLAKAEEELKKTSEESLESESAAPSEETIVTTEA